MVHSSPEEKNKHNQNQNLNILFLKKSADEFH